MPFYWNTNWGRSLLFLVLQLVLVAAAAVDDLALDENTILEEQFCQVYYTLDDDNCPLIRSRIRSEIRGDLTATLEYGDPSTQPAMVFLHGWPDTSAVFANLFAELCGEDNDEESKFFCVAPSLMDYHPDLPPTDPSELTISNQLEKFVKVIEELDLEDITLVSFDGAFFAPILVYQHPDLFSKWVILDDPLNLGTPTTRPVSIDLPVDDAPCRECEIAPNATIGIGSRIGWLFYSYLTPPLDDSSWAKDIGVPPGTWEFRNTPSIPETLPILYLHSPLNSNEEFNAWMDTRAANDNGKSQRIEFVDDPTHWFLLSNPIETIGAIKIFMYQVQNIEQEEALAVAEALAALEHPDHCHCHGDWLHCPDDPEIEARCRCESDVMVCSDDNGDETMEESAAAAWNVVIPLAVSVVLQLFWIGLSW